MTVRLEPGSSGGFPSRSLAEPVNPGGRSSGPIEGASIVRSVELDDHGVLVVRCGRLDARDIQSIRCRFVDGPTSTDVGPLESYDVWDGKAFSSTVVQFRVPSDLAAAEVVVVVLHREQPVFESTPTRFALMSADYELFLDTPVAHGRAGVYGSGPPNPNAHPEALAVTAALPGPVLDVGCGTGALISALAAGGTDVVGVEIDRPGIREAIHADVLDRVVLTDGSLPLPFPDGAFRTVVATEVLEHVEDPVAFAGELRRVSSEWVFVTVPDASAIPALHTHGVVPWHMLEGTHLHFFSPAALRNLFAPPLQLARSYRLERVLVNGTETFTSIGHVLRHPAAPQRMEDLSATRRSSGAGRRGS